MADAELQQLIQDLQRLNQVAAQTSVSLRGVNGQSTFFTGSGITRGLPGSGPSTFFTPSVVPPVNNPTPIPAPVITPKSMLPKGVSGSAVISVGNNVFNVGTSLAQGDVSGALQQSFPLLRSSTIQKLAPALSRAVPVLALGGAAYAGATAGAEVEGTGARGLGNFVSDVGSKSIYSAGTGALLFQVAQAGGASSLLGATSALAAAATFGVLAFTAGAIAYAATSKSRLTKELDEEAAIQKRALLFLASSNNRKYSKSEIDKFISREQADADKKGISLEEQLRARTQEMEKRRKEEQKQFQDTIMGNIPEENAPVFKSGDKTIGAFASWQRHETAKIAAQQFLVLTMPRKDPRTFD